MAGEDRKLRVIGRHPNGRLAYDPEEKERLIAACSEPGASVAKLAMEHGVNANLLRLWIRKAKKAKTGTVLIEAVREPRFIPVEIDSGADAVMPRPDRASAVAVPGGDERRSAPEGAGLLLGTAAKVKVSLPNGVKLTLDCADVRAVVAMIGALSDVPATR